MSVYKYFPDSFEKKYKILEWGHALAILSNEFKEQFADMTDVLARFELRKRNIITSGGGKSKVSGFLDAELYKKGWSEKSFDTSIIIDGQTHDTPRAIA